MTLRTFLVLLALAGFMLQGRAQGVDAAPQAPSRLDVNETLIGIFGYTRWPTDPNPLRLCVAGESAHADRLVRQGLDTAGARPVTVRRIGPETGVAAQCDALYVGTLDEAAWRRIFANILGQPVLTVCERSPVCAVGGMICLDIDANARVTFEINLDSVARSTVRINPQVLRLGRRPQKAP